jgi:fructosamine-3-kinase
MLNAEYLGVKEMSETGTVRVPKPVASGEHGGNAFVIFEYLEFTGEPRGGQYQLGKQLARMHRHTSEQGFGFHVDNTIGATPQPNHWVDNWPEFWDRYRLGHMLKLTGNLGMKADKVEKLRARTRELLSHNPPASLIHGDLWGGNKGFVKDGGDVVPCIFDPATYYGDREADVAMTYLFGGFSSDFYKGYNDEYPLPPGHEKRVTCYNLYHILNHYVLFGGGYSSQAKQMIEEILRQ